MINLQIKYRQTIVYNPPIESEVKHGKRWSSEEWPQDSQKESHKPNCREQTQARAKGLAVITVCRASPAWTGMRCPARLLSLPHFAPRWKRPTLRAAPQEGTADDSRCKTTFSQTAHRCKLSADRSCRVTVKT